MLEPSSRKGRGVIPPPTHSMFNELSGTVAFMSNYRNFRICSSSCCSTCRDNPFIPRRETRQEMLDRRNLTETDTNPIPLENEPIGGVGWADDAQESDEEQKAREEYFRELWRLNQGGVIIREGLPGSGGGSFIGVGSYRRNLGDLWEGPLPPQKGKLITDPMKDDIKKDWSKLFPIVGNIYNFSDYEGKPWTMNVLIAMKYIEPDIEEYIDDCLRRHPNLSRRDFDFLLYIDNPVKIKRKYELNPDNPLIRSTFLCGCNFKKDIEIRICAQVLQGQPCRFKEKCDYSLWEVLAHEIYHFLASICDDNYASQTPEEREEDANEFIEKIKERWGL